MAYRIELAPKARRDLKKLPNDVRTELQPHIEGLASNPRSKGVIKLAGEENLYRLRVGWYRIIFEIHDKVLVVLVVKIAPRKDAYR